MKGLRLKELPILKKILFSISLLFLLSCDGGDNNNNNSICNDIETNSASFSFFLQDLNPNSTTYSECIGPDTYPNSVRVFYFSNNEN